MPILRSYHICAPNPLRPSLSRLTLRSVGSGIPSFPFVGNSIVSHRTWASTTKEALDMAHAPQKQRRRFAPLDPNIRDGHGGPKLRGIVFDVDGTLCIPQNYMFKEMRAALGIPKSVDILDHIRSLSDEPDDPSSSPSSGTAANPPVEETLAHSISTSDPPPTSPQARAVAKIRSIERTAMTSQRPQPGLQELMAYITSRGIPKALCTRNFPAPVQHLLSNFLQDEIFEPRITRETQGIQPKPSPEGLWSIAQAWGLDGEIAGDVKKPHATINEENVDLLDLAKRHLGSGLIMVGDSIDDITAGRRAGAATVLLANDENQHLVAHENTDLSIRRLDELIEVLEKGFQAHQ